MRLTIFKYRLAFDFEAVQAVHMPPDAKIIEVAVQDGHVCLWAEVDADKPSCEARNLFIAGTGRPLPMERRHHLGSVVLGALVVHVYELLGPSEKL